MIMLYSSVKLLIHSLSVKNAKATERATWAGEPVFRYLLKMYLAAFLFKAFQAYKRTRAMSQ